MPLLLELIDAVNELERRLLRHGSPLAELTVRVTSPDVSIDWRVSAMRISEEDSRAIYVGPLPTVSRQGAAQPGRDVTIAGAGCQWLQRGMPKMVLLERPHPREQESGDMALCERRANKLRVAVADGLGHGPLAREAARRAVQSLGADVELDVQESVLRAHDHLAATRGATLGLVDIDLANRTIKGTTIGNVRVALFLNNRMWSPCGTDAILGHGRAGSQGRLEVRVEQHPYPPGSILALFSDGLLNQLRLPWQRSDLEETAAQLFYTFSVANDDATLLLLG